MNYSHVIFVFHCDAIQRDVHVETGASAVANSIEIAFSEVRPKSPVFISVNRKIQHSNRAVVLIVLHGGIYTYDRAAVMIRVTLCDFLHCKVLYL